MPIYTIQLLGIPRWWKPLRGCLNAKSSDAIECWPEGQWLGRNTKVLRETSRKTIHSDWLLDQYIYNIVIDSSRNIQKTRLLDVLCIVIDSSRNFHENDIHSDWLPSVDVWQPKITIRWWLIVRSWIWSSQNIHIWVSFPLHWKTLCFSIEKCKPLPLPNIPFMAWTPGILTSKSRPIRSHCPSPELIGQASSMKRVRKASKDIERSKNDERCIEMYRDIWICLFEIWYFSKYQVISIVMSHGGTPEK